MDFFPRMMGHLSDKRSKHEITDPDIPSMNHAAYKTPKMIALNNLLSRPWFSRVWTLQEGAFATYAVVVCGEKKLPFSLLEKFNAKCEHDNTGVWTDTLSSISTATPSDHRRPSRFVTAHVHGISKLKQARLGKGPKEPVTALLYRLRSCEATDARDRVYAMWSFLPDSYSQILETPHYENEFTASNLFRQVAKLELVHNHNMDFLGHAGLWQQSPDTIIPSWTADWSYRQLTHPLCVHDHDCLRKTGTKLYRASRDLDGSATISGDLTALTTQGKMLGEIMKLTNPFEFTSSHEKNESTQSSTSPAFTNVEEGPAEDESKGKVSRLKRQFEYPLRIFNETTSQIDLCFQTAEQFHPHPYNIDIKTACMHTLTASLTHPIAGPALGATLIRVDNEEVREMFKALDAAVEMIKTFDFSGVDKKAMKLLGLVRELTKTRRFLVTANGYIGLAPGEARKGDRVVIVYGCSTPLLIRKVDEAEDNWRLVGECYVYGLMDGEAIAMDDILDRDIRLL